MQLDKPNLILPLASSYNERNVKGYTATVTNGLDQRKINCMYEVVRNAGTGKLTIYLTKRPGCVDSSNTYMNASSDTPYLAMTPPNSTVDTLPWVVSRDGTNVTAASPLAVTTIVSDSSYPCYLGATEISGTSYAVLQTRTSASSAIRAFYSSAIATWTEISDSDFTGLTHRGKMEHMDGWAFQLASDNYIYNSDVNSLSSWTAGNKIKKQIQQDVAAGLMKHGQMLLAFGDETVEGFGNAGNPAGSPLQRITAISNARVGLGTLSGNGGTIIGKRHYYTSASGKTYFVGRMGGTGGFSMSLIAFDGNSFGRVSNDFIDKILSENHFYHVGRMVFHGHVAIAIALELPTATTQNWLMFFPDLNEWFEWKSTYIQPVGSGTYFIGIPSVSAQKVGYFNTADSWVDGTNTAYTMTTQFQLPQDGYEWKHMRWAGVTGDTARSAQNLSVEFSDDDYQTWSTAVNIDMTAAKKSIYRCGAYRKRAVRLSHSGNTQVRLENFIARVD